MSSNIYPFSQECSETSENLIEVSNKLWSNDIIWSEIVGYLGVNDVRALASTCTYFFDKCNELPQFTSSFNVSSRNELPKCFYNLKLTKVTVKLNDYETEDEWESALKDFGDVEKLILDGEGIIPDTVSASRLVKLISSCPKLKCLTFDSHQFLESSSTSFYTNPLVKTVLSGLTELRILWGSKDDRLGDITKLRCKDAVTIINYMRSSFKPDYESFPDLNMKLKVFQYNEDDPVDGVGRAITYFQSQFLSTSLDSLEEMNFTMSSNGLDNLKLLQFSKLKKFVIYFNSRHNESPDVTEMLSEKLIPFLHNHISTLEHLKIDFFGVTSLKPLCEVFKQSQKIKILKFICLDFPNDYLFNTDWKFLASLPALENFNLKFGENEDFLNEQNVDDAEPAEIFLEEKEEDVNWNQFLTYFPSGMKSIYLSGLYYHGRQEDLFPTVKTCLTRFTNLTKLSMDRCARFLNDETLQFICSTMNKLQTLKCEFNNVTDFGISGLRTDGSETGISLKNLKCLKKLVIYSGSGKHFCKALSITWEGLLRSIAFQQLVKLIIQGKLSDAHLRKLQADSRDGQNYLQLIKQNPCLEGIDSWFYFSQNQFREKILEINPTINWETDCRDPTSIYLLKMNK